MASPYEESVLALYRAPLEEFVAERKRLAALLKAAGDKDGATRLAKLPRPPLSAWVVNQLYQTERPSFDALLTSALRLRGGDRQALEPHRQALAKLRGLASERLSQGGHAANEATLRRVTTTLSALAAQGGFEPDLPGALGRDRDSIGFDAALSAAEAAPARAASGDADPASGTAERARAQAEAEQRERTARATERAAARARLQATLTETENLVAARSREVEQLRIELAAAEQRLSSARSSVAEIRTRLRDLDAEPLDPGD